MNKLIFEKKEAARCMLCYDAPCAKACGKGNRPDKFLQSLRMENLSGALVYMTADCTDCRKECEKACIHPDMPLRIQKLAKQAADRPQGYVDLSVDFCGVKCENPFFLSSSVFASGYDMCANALKAGWAGVVYKTIGLYRPSEVSPRFDAYSKDGSEFLGFRNMEQISDHSYKDDLETLRRLKSDFPNKVIVSSIMGQTEEEWMLLAKLSEQAGVDMIECNFSCPQMAVKGMGCDVGQSEELVGKYTAAVRRGTSLPVLAKMTPNIGNMEPPARAAMKNGATAIAAINTIKSITGLELPALTAAPSVNGESAVSGYSGKAVKPIALRFIYDLATDKQLRCPISGMGGIESWKDAAEFIALGCSNIQVTTAVMQYGYRIITDMISGFSEYLYKAGYKSVKEFSGAALKNITTADKLDRETVVYPVFDKTQCVGCGRCYIACSDAGHQALSFSDDRKPVLTGNKCVGCHLCRLVCPNGAINVSKRVLKR